LRESKCWFQRIDIRRHPVGSKACEQTGYKSIARAGGIHADNRLSAEMGKLLLECGDDARFALVTSSNSG
jgi:hypothetical protein